MVSFVTEIYLEGYGKELIDLENEFRLTFLINCSCLIIYSYFYIKCNSTIMSQTIRLFCPRCGKEFETIPDYKGKLTGLSGGAISGAMLGAKVGIAAGPLGAIAGTIPGGILGAIFGKNFGNKFDSPECTSCNLSFEIPTEMKEKYLANLLIENIQTTPYSARSSRLRRFNDSKTSFDYDFFVSILNDFMVDETKTTKLNVRRNNRNLQ